MTDSDMRNVTLGLCRVCCGALFGAKHPPREPRTLWRVRRRLRNEKYVFYCGFRPHPSERSAALAVSIVHLCLQHSFALCRNLFAPPPALRCGGGLRGTLAAAAGRRQAMESDKPQEQSKSSDAIPNKKKSASSSQGSGREQRVGPSHGVPPASVGGPGDLSQQTPVPGMSLTMEQLMEAAFFLGSRMGEQRAEARASGDPAFDPCTECGCYRAFEGMSDECCKNTKGTSCVFPPLQR